MQTLNIETFPLLGKRLIEASAGTGKTYTIASLYLRLLTGDHDLGKIAVDKILVVTFTRAATEELRGRIRDRIRDLYEDLLRQQLHPDHKLDAYHQHLVEAFVQQGFEPGELQTWLQANLTQMDESAIFTIHGFCQRILKQFAFDSGVAFESEMILDAGDYLLRAAQDFWRELAYPLDERSAQLLRAQVSGPEDVYYQVRSWLQQSEVTLLPAAAKGQSFEQLCDDIQQSFKQARSVWTDLAEQDLNDWIEQSGVDKRSFSKTTRPKRIKAALRFFTSANFPGTIPKDVLELGQENLLLKTKKGEAPEHQAFRLIDALQQAVNKLSAAMPHLILQAVREKFWSNLDQANLMNPDDLLRLLANALKSRHGELLAQHIRAQYPIAMIDEFQDTDSLQYQIFDQVYAPQDSSGLYMIGDPKQAIYSFRGADIFTYLQASQSLNAEQRFTLDTNWRSHSKLVAATNALFDKHEAAFVLPGKIEFNPVKASGHNDHRMLNLGLSDNESATAPKPLPPLQLLLNPEGNNRDRARHSAAQLCASSIQQLLAKGRLNEQGQAVPVNSGDIAVLVRNRGQAQLIKDELKSYNINSVFLSRDSVLESQQAQDLLLWLQAIAEPQNERRLRSALACQSLGHNAEYLASLLSDEVRWENELASLYQLREVFSQHGVMAFIMRWLSGVNEASGSKEALAIRLKVLGDGERTLTNILHLGEMLQQASRELGIQYGLLNQSGQGIETLLRWYSDRVQNAVLNASEEQQLRLESDANLVQIVTIHKSKGLQYPLVFLPFCWDEDNTSLRGAAHYHDDAVSGLVINTDPDDDAKESHKREQMAEAMRLLYVGLTRAEQACFVQIENIERVLKSGVKSLLPNSALGYLLGMDSFSADHLKERFANEISADQIQLQDYQQWSASLTAATNIAEPEQKQSSVLKAVQFSGSLWDSWRLTSYSQLAKDSEHFQPEGRMDAGIDAEAAQRLDMDAQDDDLSALAQAEVVQKEVVEETGTELAMTRFIFPKGATPGSCLHGILENWDFADSVQLQQQIEKQLSYYGLEEKWAAMLQDWMSDVVTQPLVDINACLGDITPAHKLVEMEFYLPMAEIRAADANQLLKGRRLVFDSMQGHLKGFIDLIFRHQGKYYVADYKSNYLGDQVSHYQPNELHSAMQHHNYDLQYWIYCIAVDKLLSERIPGYDYEQHFGGVYYFFLRGMDGSETGQGVYFTRPQQSELQAWKDWLSGAASQAVHGTQIDSRAGTASGQESQMGFWDE